MWAANKPARRPRPSCRTALALAALSALLAACAAGPDFVRPAAPPAARYLAVTPATVGADPAQALQVGGAVAADWWRLFQAPALDAALGAALAANPSLQAAEASLRQSQASLRAGAGVFYPQLDLSLSAQRQRQSPLRAAGAGAGVFNLVTLSVAVSYALDVFGGQRRAVEALAAQADAQHAALQGAYLTLSGNVVNSLIARAAYRAQIEATSRFIARQQDQLAIAEARATAGIAPYTDVLAVRSQLAASRALLPPLLHKQDQADHLLASLSGVSPGQWRAPVLELAALALPAQLPLSLPSELVRQRPDVLAAEARLHGASAAIGVATAALLPSLRLDAAYGGSGATPGSVDAAAGRFWSVGPQAAWPLFEGGAGWHRRRAAVEGYQQALAAYRQTVLDAFAQVADVLSALQHDADALQAQRQALQAAEQALTLVEANYRAGLASYLEVISADNQLYQSRFNALAAAAVRYQDSAALLVALGGGWWNRPPPAQPP